MAKRKKSKKTSAAEYIEKISSQISDLIKKDFEKSFKLVPADAKKIKKLLPKLRKQIQKNLKDAEEKGKKEKVKDDFHHPSSPVATTRQAETQRT